MSGRRPRLGGSKRPAGPGAVRCARCGVLVPGFPSLRLPLPRPWRLAGLAVVDVWTEGFRFCFFIHPPMVLEGVGCSQRICKRARSSSIAASRGLPRTCAIHKTQEATVRGRF